MVKANKEIHIEVVSDIVCPWCYVGKKQLEKSLKYLKYENIIFKIIWQPFELNPNFPKDGINRKKYLKLKFGDNQWEQSAMAKSLLNSGKEVGISFNFNSIKIMPNSRIIHAIIEVSKNKNKEKFLIEKLFQDFFENGINISNKEYLTKLSNKLKLNKKIILDCLNDKNNSLIAKKEKKYIEIGVSSVPCFIINEKFAISGAQGEKNFTKFIKMIVKNYI